jgi:hypothetical protein
VRRRDVLVARRIDRREDAVLRRPHPEANATAFDGRPRQRIKPGSTFTA